MSELYAEHTGIAPYLREDTTRSWVESIRGDEDQGMGKLLKPNVLLRIATDTNHIRNARRTLYSSPYRRDKAFTKAIMNNALPGMMIPNLLSWSATESLEQVTQTASFDCLNAHQISHTSTTISAIDSTNPIDATYHSNTITGTWAKDSLFVVDQATSDNSNVENHLDTHGYRYREENVMYRTYADQKFTITDPSDFPNPAIPFDDDDDVSLDTNWTRSAQGVGSYFVLVDREVMRVTRISSSVFSVPPGGRAINGIIQNHSVGEKVTLLNFNDSTGDIAGPGYLTIDDFKPQTSILRPGTCIVSYEGYGDFGAFAADHVTLSHNPESWAGYRFTGYWFITGAEAQLGDDGVPRMHFDMKSAGHMFEQAKINQDTLQRMKTQFGQWAIEGVDMFKAAGATRNIPGDWVDFNHWDPTLQGSYPMQIRTIYAQHKAFWQHMQDTENGLKCPVCRQELAEYLKTHKKETARDRPTGRHIYKESIRVDNDPHGGPIKTYIRLMATIAAAVWDHPTYGTELAQKFSKIPNALFDNIRTVNGTGLCYNGQLDVSTISTDKDYDWSRPVYDTSKAIFHKNDLSCPFETSYDNAPFSQPMLDLAEVNGATFWLNRHGYPVFKPRMTNLRPWNEGGEFFMAYGASLSGYTHNISSDDVITQVWVTANGPFEEDMPLTVAAAGTGFNEHGFLQLYSPIAGNKEGLALTSGVQKVDTVSMDNQVLGLEWNTKPANWGISEELAGKDIIMNARPPYYDGSPILYEGAPNMSKTAIRRVQQAINFFLIRGYINPIVISGNSNNKLNGTWLTITEDGVFGPITKQGIRLMQAVIGDIVSGAYSRVTYSYLKTYLETHKFYIQTDIWWYVRNGKSWDEYVAAITGIAVPFKKHGKTTNTGVKAKIGAELDAYDTPQYTIDEKGLQKNVTQWYRSFARQVVNVGNRRVDESINRATVRTVTSNLADPRVQPGDTIWCEIPGFLGARDAGGHHVPPYTNGIYVTSITRQFDLANGVYTASYSGPRMRGDYNLSQSDAGERGAFM